jgi:hypothetical protein
LVERFAESEIVMGLDAPPLGPIVWAPGMAYDPPR